MINIIIYLLLLSISFPKNYTDKLLLDSPFKTIDFYYSIDGYDGLGSGEGSLLVGPNNYKLDLYNITICSDMVVTKRYHKETNQIFIENAIPAIDSMFLNFLSKDFFGKYSYQKDSIIYFDYEFNNLSTNLILNKNLDSIKQINIFNEKIKFKASKIKFITDSIINMDAFNFFENDAFILDLRY